MKNFKKDVYYTPEEIGKILKSFKTEYPDLIQVIEIGRTPEKRPQYLVELTNKKTGPASDKPAIWVDANIHASEITGAQACLHFIYDTLKSRDPEIRYLLDRMTFIILPQISPDGAAFYMQNSYEVRSSPREWPVKKLKRNLIPKDLDKNKQILLMRKKDPAGAFKVSSHNPQLLTQRGVFELNQKNTDYYRLYREGEIENYDGFTEVFSSSAGFDYNRQFPTSFRPEGQQMGAGPYAGSEPEIQNLLKAFLNYPRVFAHISLHTYGGLVLRPPASQPEENYHLADISILKLLTDEAAKVSGYAALSTAADFKYYSRDSESGTEDEWTFDQRGQYSMTIEIWDVWKKAGIEVKDHVSRYFKPNEEHLHKIYSWAAKNLKTDEFYQKWTSYQHPQLGEVEIGGWKTNYLFRNPPARYLKEETDKVRQIISKVAKVTPDLHILSSKTNTIDQNIFHVEVIIENKGFLPTYGTHQAIKVAAVQNPTGNIELSSQQKLLSGTTQFEMKHLQGRSRFIPVHSPVAVFRSENSHQIKLDWLIQGKGKVKFHFDFERGGVLHHEVKLS